MRCFLAAFDQAHLADDGTYWTWRHPEVPLHVLDTLYYDIAAPHMYGRGDDSLAEKACGGWAGIDAEWLCWYRFVEGGRDKSSRPGRTVLLAVFFPRSTAPADWSGIWKTPQLVEIVKETTSCPLPQPDSLELNWEPLSIAPNTRGAAELIQLGTLSFEGTEAIDNAVRVSLGVPPEFKFEATAWRCDHGHQVRVNLATANLTQAATGGNGGGALASGWISRAVQRQGISQRCGGVVRWCRAKIFGQPAALLAGIALGIALGRLLDACYLLDAERPAVQDRGDDRTNTRERLPSNATSMEACRIYSRLTSVDFLCAGL